MQSTFLSIFICISPSPLVFLLPGMLFLGLRAWQPCKGLHCEGTVPQMERSPLKAEGNRGLFFLSVMLDSPHHTRHCRCAPLVSSPCHPSCSVGKTWAGRSNSIAGLYGCT